MPLIPTPLVDDIAEGRCLPFIGAGFSANAHLSDGGAMPTWSGLSEALALIGGIDNGEGPDVAEEYERRFGRVSLVDTVRRALHFDTVRPGLAHAGFAQLPFDTVYTTNFDLLLEDACLQVHRPFRSLVGELQLPFHAGLLATNIVKMHGDLRHEEHVVITRSDYDEFLSTYPVIATHLSAMLITRTGLFIGYSRNDPDFQQIVEVVRSRLGRFQRMSYMIQFDAAEDEIEALLDDQLHVISLNDAGGVDGKDAALAEFFSEIQRSIDKRAGKTLRHRRPDAFETVPAAALETVLDQPSGVRVLEGSSHMCFVMMPFGHEFDAVFHGAIVPAVLSVGLTAVRADSIAEPGPITEQIRVAIQNARLCVADMTGNNPNVMYEIGMAATMGKTVVLITQDLSTLPFDIASLRVIPYDPREIVRLSEALLPFLEGSLEEEKLEEGELLISQGANAAAISVLSVFLEQRLRQRAIENAPSSKEAEAIAQMALGDLFRELHAEDQLGQFLPDEVRKAIELRNATVHGVKEPSSEDARFMLAFVRRAVREPSSRSKAR
jgi:hypothetical protein